MYFQVFSYVIVIYYFFFFVKQKTAYELRIIDWSSDVCSSDLVFPHSEGTAMEFSQFNVNALMEITSRPDLVFVRGQGSWLEDHAGKRYLDVVQGWAVNTLGHSAPEMTRALLEQADTLMKP